MTTKKRYSIDNKKKLIVLNFTPRKNTKKGIKLEFKGVLKEHIKITTDILKGQREYPLPKDFNINKIRDILIL